jgi:Lrp/AsnC family transcriptional regulator, leucine-responsive regulatory protein
MIKVASGVIMIINQGMVRNQPNHDRFDLQLLELLQVDARQPVPQLAEAVGLSAPACYRRIRRLREIGAIEREVAVVKPKTLGWTLSMIVLVVLEREGNRTVSNLMRRLAEHPQVTEVSNVTGDYDFAVRMVARDMQDYGDFAEEFFANDERVRTFKTLVIIRETRSTSPLPAVHL